MGKSIRGVGSGQKVEVGLKVILADLAIDMLGAGIYTKKVGDLCL